MSILDRNRLKHFPFNMIVILIDSIKNENYQDAMERAKSIILNGVKNHVVPHIGEKDTENARWEALTKLY